jgi:hypothetical protein
MTPGMLLNMTRASRTMPLLTSGARRSCLLGAATAAVLLLAAPAAHAAKAAATEHCVPTPTLVQPFAAWGDVADYTLTPGGDFEGAGSDWALDELASIISGNEPFHVGSADDSSSLSLSAGSAALSTPICIDETYPTFRLFARNTGNLASKLRVDVVYSDTGGRLAVKRAGTYRAASAEWSPTGIMRIKVKFDASGAAPVAFRFTADNRGTWQIDDVYVDPFLRR